MNILNILFIGCFVSVLVSYVSAICCQAKEVPGSDVRSGRYSFTRDDYNLPHFCTEPCVYTKDNGHSEDFYCFGEGDLYSTCLINGTAPATGPPGVPGQYSDDSFLGPPPGEFLYNSLPGDNADAVTCSDVLALLDGDRYHRLDLAALPSIPPASLNTWSTAKLRFERLDGPNSGTVRYDHLVGLFATSDDGGIFRLNLNIPTTSKTDTSTTRFQIGSGDGSGCSGEVTYNTEYGLLTEDGNARLDIGQLTSWDVSRTSTWIHLVKLL